MDALFTVIEVLFPFLFLGTLAFIIVTAVLNWRRVRRAGFNPLTMGTDLGITALQSELLAPRDRDVSARSPSERLAELDRLWRSGAISASEHETARARVLADV